jgi:hypothetical protein
MDCANTSDVAPATKSSMGWAWLGNFLSKVWKVFKSVFSFFANLLGNLLSGLLFLLFILLILGAIKVAIDVCSKTSKGLDMGPIPQDQIDFEKKREKISGKTYRLS